MPFPLIWLIYSAVAVIAIAAIVLLIGNLIQLAASGNSINQLRDEIEKKAREMDLLRRNGIAMPASVPLQASDYPQMAPVPAWPDQQMTPFNSQEGQNTPVYADGGSGIEVIRNVRGAIDDIDSSHLQHQTISMHSPDHDEHAGMLPESPAPAPEEITGLNDMASLPADIAPALQTLEGDNPQFSAEDAQEEMPPLGVLPVNETEDFAAEDDILAVVEETESPTSTLAEPLLIPLFSPAKNDADFTLLWERFKGAVDSTHPTAVIIDFANVLFVYAKEAGYLERLADIAAQQNIPLRFIGLTTDLRVQIAAWPTLSALILEN